MNRPLTRAEERAEAALWRAKEWRGHAAYSDSDISPDLRAVWFDLTLAWHPPDPALLSHLIDIGRVYP